MKNARWTQHRVSGQITPTREVALRVGKKGTGAVLGVTRYWVGSPRSEDEAGRICAEIEEDATAQGYRILPEATRRRGSISHA